MYNPFFCATEERTFVASCRSRQCYVWRLMPIKHVIVARYRGCLCSCCCFSLVQLGCVKHAVRDVAFEFDERMARSGVKRWVATFAGLVFHLNHPVHIAERKSEMPRLYEEARRGPVFAENGFLKKGETQHDYSAKPTL